MSHDRPSTAAPTGNPRAAKPAGPVGTHDDMPAGADPPSARSYRRPTRFYRPAWVWPETWSTPSPTRFSSRGTSVVGASIICGSSGQWVLNTSVPNAVLSSRVVLARVPEGSASAVFFPRSVGRQDAGPVGIQCFGWMFVEWWSFRDVRAGADPSCAEKKSQKLRNLIRNLNKGLQGE